MSFKAADSVAPSWTAETIENSEVFSETKGEWE